MRGLFYYLQKIAISEHSLQQLLILSNGSGF